MRRDTGHLGTPEEWLKRAKSNLALAKQAKTDEIYWEDLCFETQQAAEKALKAVLISKAISFRFVHDLAELLTILEKSGVCLPEDIRNAAVLTDYSVEARYPGPFEPVTEEDFNTALKISETVVTWAEKQIL